MGVVILFITGIVCHRSTATRPSALLTRLNLYLRTIMRKWDLRQSPIISIVRDRFRLTAIRWYWQITEPLRKTQLARRVRCGTRSCEARRHGADLTRPESVSAISMARGQKPADGGTASTRRRRKFLVSVAGDASEIFDETRSFDYYFGTFVACRCAGADQIFSSLRPRAAEAISESSAIIRSGRASGSKGVP